ncbi:MAG: type II secretion system secretin GspD [Halobacteriovoraceae bacterium]|jgi:general secretion pathway protein D|nr:type II secretion system secretin GspD [Halobacteriovoraceae bacterium]MBT5093447.1 type II secretion system secretin GspD [Halobacteriovoraceae bacterium]
MTMKISKSICTTLLTFSLLFALPAAAQFKKYKERSKFKGGGANKSASTLLKKAQDNSQADVFGRGTGIGSVTGAPKSKKYVNLNPETAFGPEVVTSFDHPNTSLIDLTKTMQKLTGINLILDKDLKGKVTIMAPSPVTVGDAWKAYLTALNLNGYTLVKSGSFYKIVNSRDIRYTPTKIYTGNYTPDTENYVMRILPLKNINSTEVTRSFRPFMSRYGRIIDIKQTNTIIVQDTGSNINRLVRLIKFIDVPGHEETLQIIQVKNSSAQEIAKLLDKILKGSTSTKRRAASKTKGQNISKIIAEPRTNAIIAMANADGARQLRILINKLDVKGLSSNGGRIHVYYLNHGDAEALSKTLSSLVTSSKPTKGGSSRFTKNSSLSEPGLFTADVKITADKDNNALVVTASPTDYLTIKSVIKKLDIARDQVYVEGLMMETQVSNNKAYGINIVGAYGSGGARKAGFVSNGSDLVNVLTNNITNLGGLFVGAGVGNSVDLDVGGTSVKVNSINALITAIATNSNTNVLATPQILALDNTEAIFEVGENIPTLERTNATNGASSVSVKQQKVALTLKITPQINKVTRFVKLKIDQKIEDFSSRALPSGVADEGLATTVRSAVTTVVIRDRDTIAMGGLMRDRESSRVSKVPFLGDIPILGWLFKSTTNTIEKVNLLFFLTPKILANYQVSAAGTVKDVLNRRGAHLKKQFGESDPFGVTVKGLYNKAKKQETGPLYDVEEAARFRRSNDNSEGIKGRENENQDDDLDDEEIINLDQAVKKKSKKADFETPNYKQILQRVKAAQSAVKR